jgi:predicted TIM-barrel fold metal-dependent hydrolase
VGVGLSAPGRRVAEFTVSAIERQMQGLSPEMRQKLTHDNAVKLYGLA